MTEAIDLQTRVKAIAAAQGKEPFDLLLTGGRIVDVATLELREADIGIVGAMIASVHPRGKFEQARETHDLGGLVIAPGFIDGHVHFESSHMLPHHYASVVVPQGTTTIFCDPHELANVLGVKGARWAVDATRGLPLRFIVQRMADTGLTRFPVIDRGTSRRLVGMISLDDLLKARALNLEAERRRERTMRVQIAFPFRMRRPRDTP